MEKDFNKIIKRLIVNSQKILDEFEVLSNLSFYDKEDTIEFDQHIENTRSFLNSEAVILNNLDLGDLKEIYQMLPEYDDKTEAYERIHITIDNLIETANYEKNDNYDGDKVDSYPYDDNDNTDDDEDITRYYLDHDNEKYEMAFLNYIKIYTLKRIADRIDNTISDNKNDSKYKKKLLKRLKTFKYFIFGDNVYLEKYGLNNRFNVAKMPYLECPDVDVSIISYNRCVSLLFMLYNPIHEDDPIEDTIINLYNMMRFEAYLNNVNDTEIDRLVNLCYELDEKYKDAYLGNIAKSKILTREKN